MNPHARLQMASMSEIFDVKSETGTDYDVLQSSFITKDMQIGILKSIFNA